MSLTVLDRRGRTLVALPAGRVVRGLVEAVAIGAMAAVVIVEAPSAPLWPAAFFVAIAAVAATAPDTPAGLIALLTYGGWWLALVHSPAWTPTVVAAAAALAFHLTLGHAAAAPPGAHTDAAVVRALALDGGLVIGVVGAAAFVLAAVSAAGVRTSTLVAALSLVLLAVVPRLAAGVRANEGDQTS